MYAKVFGKIMDSSIAADWYLRHVFMDLLVLADRDGVVDMTIDAIKRRTNAPSDGILEEAIRHLERPDPHSRSEDDDGRRIELLDEHRDWGWRIINYEKYRKLKTSQEIRDATRERVRRHRAKKRGVTPPVTQAEANAYANALSPGGAAASATAPAAPLKQMPKTPLRGKALEEAKTRAKIILGTASKEGTEV